MSKNDTKEPKTEMVKPPTDGVTALTQQAKALTSLQGAEQLRALQDLMGIDAADVEVIAAGSLPFWPAFAGAILVGTVQNRRETVTKFKSPQNPEGIVGLYTVTVEERSCLAGTLDGEIFELQPGENITLLERTVMKELRTRVGQKVGILCLGKKTGKSFEYWDYKILGQKRSAMEIQAASQQLMANMQAKQLESHNSGE